MRLWVALLFCAGCGPGSFEEFRDQYVSRLCENARHCGVIGRHDPCPLPDSIPSAGPLDVPAAVMDQKLQYHSQRGQECLDALEGAPCDPAIVAIRIREHCHNVIGPNVASGEACRGDEECVGGTCTGSFACPGRCVPWPAPNTACQPGECDPTVQYCGGEPALCRPKFGEMGKCTRDVECHYPLVCANGTCAHYPRIPDGKECGFPEAVCDDQRYCAPSSGQCAPLQARDTACDSRQGCTRDHGCDAADGGICRPWADEGQPCTDTLCPLSQTCVADRDGGDADAGLPGTCRADPLLPAGPHESCDHRACAEGLYCARGNQRCQYLHLFGGVCSSDDPGCADGLACDPKDTRCKPPAMICDGGVSDGGSRD